MAFALELRCIEKSFGATAVLRGVDLAVQTGEFVALIGPNGAGKSSLFDTIGGRWAPTSGEVLLHGRAVGGLAPRRLRRRGLSRSFQITQLFAELDVRDHLRCALAGSGATPLRWLRPFAGQAAIEAETDRLLDLLELRHRAASKAPLLSYAEQRLLEIGLAFAGAPAVVLLDEPTAGMSREETAHCIATIRALARGRTVVMVEHDMEVVFGLADRIAVLVDGRILAIDTPDQIRAHEAVRAAYTGMLQPATDHA
ncbi:ABC transporter ATP-binding protein [Xylophilus sp. GOD-11R]|uniref:ABC transporter ATP-binding protein n=1 Tax=Xylophilus sp. GOD-11R TaxID=3089814 RepID=UPI00298C612E|nr:ATP-binding cassette domain-containing protein [Xylophilus sp. GOD-11R]WPB59259.1 ATP-binding cassette domain-containing protein [Xylophilus sp. GOD-11R]